MSVNVCTRAEKDAIADLIGDFRFTAGFGKTAVPAGAARHRRAPRRDAAPVPAAGGDADPGRAAQGHLRHGHPGRGDQRADPHRAVHRAVQVRRDQDPAAAGPRVPPDRRAGGPGRVRHRRAGAWCRPPSTWWRTRRPWPRRATTRRRGARWSARSRPTGFVAWGKPTFERLVAADPGAADVELQGHARHGAERHRPAGRRVRRDAPPADRQPRGPPGAAAAHPPGHRHLPGAAGRRGGRAAARAGRRGPHWCG